MKTFLESSELCYSPVLKYKHKKSPIYLVYGAVAIKLMIDTRKRDIGNRNNKTDNKHIFKSILNHSFYEIIFIYYFSSKNKIKQ